ncbi:TetR/AcrR family transcriptional regulator [Synechococcus sp. Nb3U1]|uniref:TetR/AcrR family transcriptional regulator n=1 Tax=Synechococcus sp. Nb3U1 TaxID=1914529 RepID=UPI001F252D61|nr:TetR/AcrR family transcriptional regulator [Synechococcus sp. Nb3U1]MCF2970682.1 TetR/AcrR family transcriptional regulator [Synechococcus sp. Nb3U1]
MAYSSSRQRLLNAARDLFVRQGITQTTTRQIADLAGVNEVTLFRHFGTKQGLLLAVFGELGVFSGIADLPLEADPTTAQGSGLQAILMNYVNNCFRALADNPELVRSLVGEAGLYSEEHRYALRLGFSQAQEQLTEYLRQFPNSEIRETNPNRLYSAVGVLHLMILGAAMLAVTAELPSDSRDPSEPAAENQGIPPLLRACVELWMAGIARMR